MTPEENQELDRMVADAAVKLDKLLQQRWDEFALKLISDGTDPNDVVDDDEPDPDSPWRRITMDEALQIQKARDLEWKIDPLEAPRAALAAHYFPPQPPKSEDPLKGGRPE